MLFFLWVHLSDELRSNIVTELPPQESSKKWLKRRRGQRMRGVVASKYVPMYF